MGSMICSSLRKYGVTAPIDVHLMVTPVDRVIEQFAEAGATYISIHPDATVHLDRSLSLIKSLGCKAGLVFNPASPLDACRYVMDKLDLILLMSVNPGFGGQTFIPSVLHKVSEARRIIDDAGHDIRLEIDGGIKVSNVAEVAAAGADMFVAGTEIFNQDDYYSLIKQFRKQIEAGALNRQKSSAA
jgi:ribulose-phosphate 3-epimerase